MPPLAIFNDAAPADYFRFRLGPEVVIAAGTRVKRPGEERAGRTRRWSRIVCYEPGSWGPPAAATVLAGGERWHDPNPDPKEQ